MTEQAQLTVAQVVEALRLTPAACANGLADVVSGAVVCDLLSHVMAHGKRGDLWITIQTHPNTVAVAQLGGLAGIIVADSGVPAEETVMRSEDEGMPLLTSDKTTFTLAGELYMLGVR
jgi:hypothetical protein